MQSIRDNASSYFSYNNNNNNHMCYVRLRLIQSPPVSFDQNPSVIQHARAGEILMCGAFSKIVRMAKYIVHGSQNYG